MRFAERAGLDAAMSDIVAAPQSEAAIDILCCQPDFDERWLTAPWRKLPDGSPDPAIKVSILAARVYEAVVVEKQNMLHPGDTMISDLDRGLRSLSGPRPGGPFGDQGPDHRATAARCYQHHQC